MTLPSIEHRYHSPLMDSARWQRFTPRDSDIIVSTPYKSGTTWTQWICALLIFGKDGLREPLSRISPWLDQNVYPIEEVAARYAAQTHRRIIKTHTPLTALPYYPDVTYLVCVRDPRDVFISMQNHHANLDMVKFQALLARNSDLAITPPVVPDDINAHFRLWLEQGSFPWETDGYPFWSVFHHVQSFWRHRELPNIHLLHYADLKRDLAGEMRRVAQALGIAVDVAQWPALIEAARFEAMKARYVDIAPNTDQGIWLDGAKFFNKGSSGQWQDVLNPESLDAYAEFKRTRLDPALAAWIDHR